MSDEIAAEPTPPSSSGVSVEFGQTGTAGGITPIVLLNAVLNIITLTLWRFWARTNVRRYLWSTTTINGEGLEYTGSGWQLFRAFLIVMIGIFLPISAAAVAGQFLLSPEVFVMIFAIAYIPLVFFFWWLFGIAIWMARRFRLSRTRWRGIRFGMSGSANGYAWASIGYGFLSSLTLGWYAPAAEMRLFRRLWNDSYFGDRKFHITHGDDGLAGPLYPTFALAWFGGLVGYAVFIAIVVGANDLTSGKPPNPTDPTYLISLYGGLLAFVVIATLLGMPYFTALLRRQAQVVGLEGLTFSLKATSASLFWLYIGNLLIVIFTLGFGLAYAQLRTFKYIFSRLSSEGVIDLEAVHQNADKGPKSGEGLADFFDIGAV